MNIWPPLKDIRFVMQDLAGLDQVASCRVARKRPRMWWMRFSKKKRRFAGGVLSPPQLSGDQDGAQWKDTVVFPTRRGSKEAYRQFRTTAGTRSVATGFGEGLPRLLATAVSEMCKASNHAFSLSDADQRPSGVDDRRQRRTEGGYTCRTSSPVNGLGR